MRDPLPKLLAPRSAGGRIFDSHRFVTAAENHEVLE